MADSWDALVCGGGPAGAVSASLLARRGFRVLLVDRARFPRPKACAEFLSPGVVQALERIGVGERFAASGPRYFTGMVICGPRGATFRVSYESGGRTLPAAALPRRVLDAMLVEHARDAGAVVREGVTVRRPIAEAGRITGVETNQGDIRARLVLAADGVNSVLTRAAGLRREARWPRRVGLVAHVRDNGACDDGFGRMIVWHGGYCGIAPLPADLLNIGMVLPENALQGTTAVRVMAATIRQQPGLRALLEGSGEIERVRGVLPVGVRSSHPAVPGMLLVGDAAGFFDPFTGEGIYRAIRGAELAADAADACVSGRVRDEAMVRSYTRARTRAFRSKSAVTGLVQVCVRFPALLEYTLPRLSVRPEVGTRLSHVLGDLVPASAFLTPRMLWDAFRP